MPLFGFAVNYMSGSTDYVLVAASSSEDAERSVRSETEGMPGVESITPEDAEQLVASQYGDFAVLSTELAG